MMSFLGSYKTKIGNSLKQVESQSLVGKGPKKRQENLGPSPFRIVLRRNCNMHHKHRATQTMEEG